MVVEARQEISELRKELLAKCITMWNGAGAVA
jgi:hypothetical protein